VYRVAGRGFAVDGQVVAEDAGAARAPECADSARMITVIGSSEIPASSGEWPETCRNSMGSRSSAPPGAP
jgi:hypothetical protein